MGYLMREKGEASILLQNFVIIVKIQFGRDVKMIQNDSGFEFLSGPIRNSVSKKDNTSHQVHNNPITKWKI